MAIESLAQQVSTFVDSLSFKPANIEKSTDEAAQEAKVPAQGDSVTISEEARALVAAEDSSESNESGGSGEDQSIEQTIKMLKERIEKLEAEIDELEDSNLPEKEKRTQVQDKEVQLMELRDQLLKAEQTKLKLDGDSIGGGTRARGFGNSASNF